MAAPPSASRPGRALAALLVLVAAMFLSIPWIAPDAVGDERLSLQDKFTPRLGLDLEGGTQIILQPRPAEASAGKVTQENISRAVEIIQQRVNAFGVAEAEVAAQGTGDQQSIVISIPGERNEAVLDRVRQTAELRFRQVLAAAAGVPVPPPTASPAPTGSAAPTRSPAARPSAAPKPTASIKPAPTATANNRVVPKGLTRQPLAAATPPPSVAATPTQSAAATSPAPAQSPAAPASGPGAITPELQRQFEKLDCSDPDARAPDGKDDPNTPVVACHQDGSAKYILGRAELVGTDVKSARALIGTNAQGVATTGWQVTLDFTGDGADKFADVTTRVYQQPEPTNQVAIVLDEQVVSSPRIQQAITGGQAQITGQFTQAQAQALANVLRYGALPLSFTAGSVDEVSPTLGSDQLRAGLIAGALGLGAVVLYSLLYYRGLGLVSIFSLIIAGVLTWGAVVLLGWWIEFRLSLAGVAGLIVAIGITADSFIVYFERLRDEVRDGRPLRTAVENGWVRARRTILAADFVSLLAAIVLWALSVGGVRGFAFTLGLTTIIDVIVVFLFTKPLVTLLARTEFFGGGHKLSGFDPAHLGVSAWRPRATRPAAGTAAATRTMPKEA